MANHLVGADDAVLPVLELDIGGVRLHQGGGHRLPFSMIASDALASALPPTVALRAP